MILNANSLIAIYLILIMVFHYAIVVYAPYIDVPWLPIVVYMLYELAEDMGKGTTTRGTLMARWE